MSASAPLSAVDFKGRSLHATIEHFCLPNIGNRIVLSFLDDHGLTVPVVLMPQDAQALAKALEMFAQA
jgi:hypothetical protein